MNNKLKVYGEALFDKTALPQNTSTTGTNIISAGGTMGSLQAVMMANGSVSIAAGKVLTLEIMEDDLSSGNFSSVSAKKTITAPSAVAATGTITIATTNMTADKTITIGSVTLTAKASGASTNQFNIGATAAATATAIAALTVTGVTLSASGAVVTVTASSSGIAGNNIALASDDGAVTVSGAKLSGGSDGGISFTDGEIILKAPLTEETKDYTKAKMTTDDSSASGNVDVIYEYLPR